MEKWQKFTIKENIHQNIMICRSMMNFISLCLLAKKNNIDFIPIDSRELIEKTKKLDINSSSYKSNLEEISKNRSQHMATKILEYFDKNEKNIIVILGAAHLIDIKNNLLNKFTENNIRTISVLPTEYKVFNEKIADKYTSFFIEQFSENNIININSAQFDENKEKIISLFKNSFEDDQKINFHRNVVKVHQNLNNLNIDEIKEENLPETGFSNPIHLTSDINNDISGKMNNKRKSGENKNAGESSNFSNLQN